MALQFLVLSLPARARPLLRALYEALARAYLVYLLRGEPGAGGYVRASHAAGDAIYGLSDLDMVVVVPGAEARERVRRRAVRARRVTAGRVIDFPLILGPRDLREVTPSCTRTYGLGRGGGALYYGETAEEERTWIAERPELYGPTAGWRHVRGRDSRPGSPSRRAGVARIAAWSEVQYLWLLAFSLCADPGTRSPMWVAYMCLKLQADSLRAWLWLAHGERVATRVEALERARELLPDEEQALTEAVALASSPGRSPGPPLGAAVGCLARTSARIAALLEADSQDAGLTEVALVWDGPGGLALPYGGWVPGGSPLGDVPEQQLLPLADWRAVASPAPPDEAFALLPGRPDDPDMLAAAAPVGGTRAAYPALLAGELLIMPSSHRPRCGLRSAQCAPTDPVSFALVNGRNAASFPELPGLAARDWAARGVAEHRAWLEDPSPAPEHTGKTLGRLITAARAGLFQESVAAGEPQLALTAVATLRLLGSRGGEGAAAEAAGAYAGFCDSSTEIPESTVAGLRSAVTALPGY